MGEARRRKLAGTMPEKTPKPEQKARIKCDDNMLIGCGGLPSAIALLMGAKRRERSDGLK